MLLFSCRRRDDVLMHRHPRFLIGLLGALLASSSQVKRLHVSTVKSVGDYVHLPDKILSMISMVSSLEYLTVDIPKYRNLEALTGSIYSLRKLKVQSLALQHFAFAVYGCRWHLHIEACSTHLQEGGLEMDVRSACCLSHVPLLIGC